MNVLCYLLALVLYQPGDEAKACCKQETGAVTTQTLSSGPEIPNITVRDQDGRERHLFSDLIEGKVVAISFIFTTCTTICPPIGANFAKLEKELGERAGRDVHLISLSVDPLTDTPQRLKAWKDQFEGGDGWTLLTAAKTEMDKALKAMQFYTADKTDHSPFLLLGNQKTGQWRRVNGFAEPARLVAVLDELAAEKQAQRQPSTAQTEAQSEGKTAAGAYFTDLALIDQNGVERKLYSDLMRGKIVVMQSFFASCQGVCPRTVGHFKEIQGHLGERLGKDVHMLSISVDPVNDTPARLGDYAKQWQARDGWYFLSGDAENVRTALHKFGQLVENRENHSNVFVIGNVRTGLWKKAFGLSEAAAIIKVLDSVLADHG